MPQNECSLTAVKTKVTFKIDQELLREARALAAKEGHSLSTWVAELLESVVRARREFEVTRRRALSRLKSATNLGKSPPGSRDELHER